MYSRHPITCRTKPSRLGHRHVVASPTASARSSTSLRDEQPDVERRASAREWKRNGCSVADRVLVGPELVEPLGEELLVRRLGLLVAGRPGERRRRRPGCRGSPAHPGDRLLDLGCRSGQAERRAPGGPWAASCGSPRRRTTSRRPAASPLDQHVEALALPGVEVLHPRRARAPGAVAEVGARGEEFGGRPGSSGVLQPRRRPPSARSRAEPVVDHVVAPSPRSAPAAPAPRPAPLATGRPPVGVDLLHGVPGLAQALGEAAHARAVQDQLLGVEGYWRNIRSCSTSTNVVPAGASRCWRKSWWGSTSRTCRPHSSPVPILAR